MDAIIKSGGSGQAIIIFPSLDMVVIFTGENNAHDNNVGILTEIVTQYILPAMK